MKTLDAKLKNLPKKPGVYLFKGASGEVLYVGKAKNLKNRIKSYFYQGKESLMLRQIGDLDYIIVSNETESLILENNLIKQYRPRFNVRLRDDKNYQFIKIDYETEIPQIYPVRKMARNTKYEILNTKYFGPYTSAVSVRETLKLLRRIFHICSNKKVSNKPCFHYHLNRCPGVCIGKISLNAYRDTFKTIEQFLRHKQTQIVKDLKQQMREVAKQKQFEKAALIRDKIRALQNIWERQKIVFTTKLSQDYLSLAKLNDKAAVNLFVIREGRMIHQETFELDLEKEASDIEALEAFIKQYYVEASDLPKEIIMQHRLPEKELYEKWLGTKIIKARRGRKRQLLDLGYENAKDYLQRTYAQIQEVLAGLKSFLRLPSLPRRIEAYDISNIQGFLPAGSMIVFENGLPKKSDYRKFKINIKQTPDDVAMMKEMLTRRFAKPVIASEAKQSKSDIEIATAPQVEPRNDKITWPLPDLIVIDGGRGQLNAALSVLKAKSYKLIPVIGLAKRLEEIYVPDKKEPLHLSPDSPILHLLQRIRDEAHRFAIAFYRVRHRKEQARSRLDEIPGIGPKLKTMLMQKFHSISGIRSSSLEGLSQVVGSSKAKKLKELL